MTLREAVLADLLLACARQPDLSRPPEPLCRVSQEVDRSTLAQLAARHRLLGLLRVQSLAAGWEGGETVIRLEQAYRGQLQAHLLKVIELQRVLSAFEGTGIAALVIKGPVLAETLYGDPGLRNYGDLDVLIRAQDLEFALDVLHEQGAVLFAEPWSTLRITERAQLNIVTARGVALDLHWNMFNSPVVRRAFQVAPEELLAARQKIKLSHHDTWTMSAPQSLVHLASHALLSGADLLIWALDVHLAAQEVRDWDEVVRVARRWGLGLVVAVMLDRTDQLLNTGLPDGLLTALSGQALWRSAASVLTRARPPQRTTFGTGRLLFTSTRQDTLASTRELAREVYRHALLPLVTDDDHPWRVALRHGRRRRSAAAPWEAQAIGSSEGRRRFLEEAVSRSRGA